MTRNPLPVAVFLLVVIVGVAYVGVAQTSSSPAPTSSSSATPTASPGNATSSSASSSSTPPTASNGTVPTNSSSPPHTDYYCDGQMQSSPCPSPTYKTDYYCYGAKEPQSSPCPSPTYHTDYYCDGRLQSSPCPYPTRSYTYAPPPTVAPPAPNQNYRFELVGKTLYQDVWVSSAQSVVIRDSQIYGNLGISFSSHVVLENVHVKGQVMVDSSNDVSANRVNVGGMFGFSRVASFHVSGGELGFNLGCFRCEHGSFSDLSVAGQVYILESIDVQQVNVRAQSAYSDTFAPPPAQAGAAVALNVTGSSLLFVHKVDVRTHADTDAQLDVDAIKAKARLEVPSKNAESPVIRLDSRFEKLQEFVDKDGNGAYDLGDLIVREFLIDELPVAGIHQEPLEGEGGWVGRIDYALPNGATLSLIFKAKDNDANRTKIDVEIRDYSYASRDSQLALQVRLASASDWDLASGEGTEDRVTFHGDGFDGFFSWINYAAADGQDSPVTARVLEEHRTASGDREIVLYLGYARARHIVHDPSIGLVKVQGVLEDLGLPSLGNLLVYGSTLVAVLVVLWALGQPSKRRNRTR